MTDPLPCPFCGKTEIAVVEGDSFRWLVAQCIHCGAQSGDVRKQTMGSGTPDVWLEKGKEAAIKEWNTRAS